MTSKAGNPGADQWRALNRANWDERVALHLAAPMYSMAPLHEGRARFDRVVEAELGDVAGQRILHLQCHFGRDSLILAQRGADVTGVDFSPPAIAAAARLAGELGLSDRARFVLSDVYAAPDAVGGAGRFDRVFVTWGTIGWLPDVAGWARVVSRFLRPGGTLYFADNHPAALVFDDDAGTDGPIPGPFIPYLGGGAVLLDDPGDYAGPGQLEARQTVEWLHPLGAVVTALIEAGMTLDWLHEHDCVPWQMFECLTEREPGLWSWPGKCWLPLAMSLQATRR